VRYTASIQTESNYKLKLHLWIKELIAAQNSLSDSIKAKNESGSMFNTRRNNSN
jgi:hypothetical protein